MSQRRFLKTLQGCSGFQGTEGHPGLGAFKQKHEQVLDGIMAVSLKMNQVYMGYRESCRVIQVPVKEAGSLF